MILDRFEGDSTFKKAPPYKYSIKSLPTNDGEDDKEDNGDEEDGDEDEEDDDEEDGDGDNDDFKAEVCSFC